MWLIQSVHKHRYKNLPYRKKKQTVSDSLLGKAWRTLPATVLAFVPTPNRYNRGDKVMFSNSKNWERKKAARLDGTQGKSIKQTRHVLIGERRTTVIQSHRVWSIVSHGSWLNICSAWSISSSRAALLLFLQGQKYTKITDLSFHQLSKMPLSPVQTFQFTALHVSPPRGEGMRPWQMISLESSNLAVYSSSHLNTGLFD